MAMPTSPKRSESAPAVVGVRVVEYNGLVDRRKGGEDFEGESEDEAMRSPSQPRVVRVSPRTGGCVTVMAMSDLHRHQSDAFIVDPHSSGPRLTLAQYLSTRLTAEVDILALAGDLGLEQNEELMRYGARGVDTRATGKRQSAREKDEQTLRSWRDLFSELLRIRPEMHIVLVAGS